MAFSLERSKHNKNPLPLLKAANGLNPCCGFFVSQRKPLVEGINLKIFLPAVFAMILLFCCVFAHAEEININAIIQIESSGNPYAISKNGCIGLMQISRGVFEDFLNHYTDTHRNIGLCNLDAQLFNPEQNKEIGTWYINERIPQLLKHYNLPDTIENRLIAYHDGIGNLVKYRQGKRKLGKEMRSYLKKYKRLAKQND